MTFFQMDWEAAMTLESDVARHYTTGKLLARINAALGEAGADPAHPTLDDLKPVDEFHTGGLDATLALLDQIELASDSMVYDLGCGIGGTARLIADRYGASVEGIDLTQEYIDAGCALNDRLGMGETIKLHQGSILELPWDAASADLVTMLHVGMNIADKQTLFAQVARCLKLGGRFAVFDVMRGAEDGDLLFPLPWSTVAETSHVEAPSIYGEAAQAAGLEIEAERDRSDFAKAYFERVSRYVAANGTPPIGIHLMMSGNPAQKLENYLTNLHAGRIAPTEMIFRKPPI